jgi:type IV secretion system protein VirB2
VEELEKRRASRLINHLFFKGGSMKSFSEFKLKSGFERQLMITVLLGIALVTIIPDVSAQTFADACDKVTGFFAQFETILRVASVSIVTIAVVFAGYQIAFAHKRLSDVAPILIGGLLIGGAATIAGWFVGDWVPNEGAATTCGAQDE